MSRPELARLADIPYATLAGIENADQGTSTRLHSIAKALNVRIEWLETGKGPREQTALDRPSHPVRLDPEIVRDVAQALLEVYHEELGSLYRITDEPEIFTEMYERTVATGDVNSRSNVLWLGAIIDKKRDKGEVNGKAAGTDDQGDGPGTPGHRRKEA